MTAVLELLPLALGIAVSPVPLVALLVLLLTPDGAARGIAFATGWTAGVALSVGGLSLLSTLIPGGDDGPRIAPVIVFALGVLLLVSSVATWRRRGSGGDHPSWVTRLERVGPIRTAAFSFGYAVLRPKNLVLTGAAGVIVTHSAVSTSGLIASVVVFTLAASSTMIAPVVILIAGGPRVRSAFEATKTGLLAAMPAITSILLALIGLALVIGALVE